MKTQLSNKISKDDQEILKTVFNRGIKKGKTETMEDFVDKLTINKIKVNLG
ncbi:MAG TPA: hypothetical protein VJ895_01970 [Candidatus Nanoarchaeia archaeon]|nr:hypothetical protein [Candidatus Nanoarchaeia archaeon]